MLTPAFVDGKTAPLHIMYFIWVQAEQHLSPVI